MMDVCPVTAQEEFKTKDEARLQSVVHKLTLENAELKRMLNEKTEVEMQLKQHRDSALNELASLKQTKHAWNDAYSAKQKQQNTRPIMSVFPNTGKVISEVPTLSSDTYSEEIAAKIHIVSPSRVTYIHRKQSAVSAVSTSVTSSNELDMFPAHISSKRKPVMTVYPNTTGTAAISPEVKENIEQHSYSDDRDSKSSQNKEVKAMFSDGSQSSKQQEEKPMMVVYPTTGKGMSSALKRMENQPLGLSNNDNGATQEKIIGTAKPIKCLKQSSEQEEKKPRMVVHPYTRKSLFQEINDNDENMLQCSSDDAGIATENNQETNWNMRKVNDNIYYDIDTELGRGASSTVFKGTFKGCHKHTKGFPIAVKRVSFKTKHDAKTTEREQTHLELKMIEKLEQHRHKNIVGFYGSHINNCKLFLAFELCQGTLCDYVTNGELFVHLKTLLKPVQVNKEISCGLSYMHSHGIAHRDLKPANILFVIHDDARVVIGDFGSATAVDENVASSFDTSGTLGFIAPETYQAFCNSGSDSMTLLAKKSDVFSLGLLFYFCVTSGKHPYGSNPMESQKNISDGILPNLNELEKKHYALEDMLENMFAYNPNDRPNAYDVEIHPALWEPKRIMEYFVDRSDTFEEFIKLTPGQKSMLEDTYLLPNGNWMRNMPEKLKNHLKHYKYDGRYLYKGKGNSARFLLRTIRNIDSHFRGFPEDVRAVLGKKYPDDHVNFWLGICPKFLLHVHRVLNRISLSA